MKITKLTIYSLFTVLLCCISCKKEETKKGKTTEVEQKVNDLLAKMSLEEKIGQLNLRGTSSRVKDLPEELKQKVREGKVGAFLNIMNKEYVDELQRIATKESPNKIPLIFARDVIHGFKTIFPIPLGLAASWDAEVTEASSRVAAIEASTFGVRWTFAPMLDIARDSRWGRIAESPGEDPYLASKLGEAYVKGFQGDSLNDPTSMIACAKHFIGYGAAIGGRDYNTATINKELMQNVYLPPFKAAFKAGSQTTMSSFNETNGIPASGDKKLLTNILRDENGFAKDEKHAAELGVNAGMNMEMTSTSYEDHIKTLLEEGKVSKKQINNLVADILRVKFRMGLFENAERNPNEVELYAKKHLELAKQAAIKSSVLLKNKENILPLSRSNKIALIGPLADKPREQLGTWTFDGDGKHSVTPVAAFKNEKPNTNSEGLDKGQSVSKKQLQLATSNNQKVNFSFVEGLSYSRDKSKAQFQKAVNVARKSDVIVFMGGEEAILSGEAHSRANINLPGAQEALIKELAKTGKPIVLVIMAGRPITLTNIIDDVDAVLMAWHPGTMGGEAIYDMLYGVQEPTGRLPITWPKTAGQLPLFYNHKNSIPVGAWQSSLGNTSHYLDVGFAPHFPFGYGLGYTTFEYSNLSLSTNKLTDSNEVSISVSIKNTGSREGEELVQLYIQDVVGSITRPVKELKGFEKIKLKSGEKKTVSFKISVEDLKYYNSELIYGVEKGDFNLWVGKNASEGLKANFTYE